MHLFLGLSLSSLHPGWRERFGIFNGSQTWITRAEPRRAVEVLKCRSKKPTQAWWAAQRRTEHLPGHPSSLPRSMLRPRPRNQWAVLLTQCLLGFSSGAELFASGPLRSALEDIILSLHSQGRKLRFQWAKMHPKELLDMERKLRLGKENDSI